ncbi:ferritin-like domain-containing protein [Roseicella aquatilis]|nr:ferritin family protein [Roseicella aquatilis]
MPSLKSEPPEPVRSLDELFSLAESLETEAARRYAELAEQMAAQDLPEVAAVFRDLAEEERGHAEHVAGWARNTTGSLPDSARIRWQPPETFDEEEARQITSSRLASAYRALSMAVRNEERAFALWAYIAAQAEAPAIRTAAERMAGEELRHAALLRRARRRAWHAERDRTGGGSPRPPALHGAGQAEAALARLLHTLADSAAPSAAELRRLAAEAEDAAQACARLGGEAAPSRPAEGASPASLEEVLRLAERAAEAYLDAADAAREEDSLHRLQQLAEGAIARIAVLRRLAGRG